MVNYDYICSLNYNPQSQRSEYGIPLEVTWRLIPFLGEQIVKDNMVLEGAMRMALFEMANGSLPDVECRARYTLPGPGVEIKVRIKRNRAS